MKTATIPSSVLCLSLLMNANSLQVEAQDLTTHSSKTPLHSPQDRIVKILSSGKMHLNTRMRYEGTDSHQPANAVTLRTRMGYHGYHQGAQCHA